MVGIPELDETFAKNLLAFSCCTVLGDLLRGVVGMQQARAVGEYIKYPSLVVIEDDWLISAMEASRAAKVSLASSYWLRSLRTTAFRSS